MQALGLLALLLGIVGLAGCGGQQKQKPKGMPPAEVEATFPIEREVTDFEEFSGRTEAEKTVELRARVTGYLKKAPGADPRDESVVRDSKGQPIKEGADVEEGQLLFEIDPRPYKADLARAEANVIQAEAHLRRLESDYRRAAGLRTQGAIPREEYDRIVGDRDEAQAALGSAQAQRETARLNVEYTEVRAPFAGRIGRKNIDPGNLVQANTTPLTTILTLDPMKATYDADERTVLRVRRLIREGKIKSATVSKVPVFMGLADEDTFPLQGIVDFVDNRVDPNTGTLRLRGVFANPGKVLTPGLFVRVRVPIGVQYSAVLIPDSALSSEQGTKFVYVLSEIQDAQDKETGETENADSRKVYRAKRRDVVIGAAQEGGLRVIKEGLSPGEMIVVEGLQRVRDGAKVIPTLVAADRKKQDTSPASSATHPTIPKSNKPLEGEGEPSADAKDASGRYIPPGRNPSGPGRKGGKPR